VSVLDKAREAARDGLSDYLMDRLVSVPTDGDQRAELADKIAEDALALVDQRIDQVLGRVRGKWIGLPLKGADVRPLADLRLAAGLSLGDAAVALGWDRKRDATRVSNPELRGLAPSLATFVERGAAYGLELDLRVRQK
jgi:hypothetical protein